MPFANLLLVLVIYDNDSQEISKCSISLVIQKVMEINVKKSTVFTFQSLLTAAKSLYIVHLCMSTHACVKVGSSECENIQYNT